MITIIGQKTLADQITKTITKVKENGGKFFQVEVEDCFKGSKKGHSITINFLLDNQRKNLQKLWSDKVEVIMDLKNFYNSVLR